MFAVIVALLFLGGVICEVDPNSIRGLSFNAPQVDELANLVDDPGLLDINVCKLTDENWESLRNFLIQLNIKTGGVNYNTGTFNFSLFDVPNLPKEHREQFEAAQCDEEYHMEEDMDSKIYVVGKGFLLRQGNCPGVTTKAVACKEDEGDDEHDGDGKPEAKKREHSKSKSKRSKLQKKIKHMKSKFS